MDSTADPKSREKNKTTVNVSIDKDELDSIRKATHVDMNASALLAAARVGRDVLARVVSSSCTVSEGDSEGACE